MSLKFSLNVMAKTKKSTKLLPLKKKKKKKKIKKVNKDGNEDIEYYNHFLQKINILVV